MTKQILNVCILQLKRKPETARLLFSSLKELERMGRAPSMDNYYKVWFEDHSREEPGLYYDDYDEMLEDIFYTFNECRPANFNGHSLSVGDVIAVTEADDNGGTGKTRYFYTDAIGFQELTDF